MLFRSKETVPYSCVTFANTLMDPLLSSVKITDIGELQAKIDSCNIETSQGRAQAIKFAQKMAVLYGVPGLINYVNLEMKKMIVRMTEGETVEAQCLNTLSYLYLAKLIYESEGRKNSDVANVLPDEAIADADYWDKKISLFAKFGKIESLKGEAQNVAAGMFKSAQSSADSKPPL